MQPIWKMIFSTLCSDKCTVNGTYDRILARRAFESLDVENYNVVSLSCYFTLSAHELLQECTS